MAIPEMISLEDARELVLSRVSVLETEEVGILEIIGRVAPCTLRRDEGIPAIVRMISVIASRHRIHSTLPKEPHHGTP